MEADTTVAGPRRIKPENNDAIMVIVKASKDTEAGVMPSTELLTAMGEFNEELVKGGVMRGRGPGPTAKGARIKYGAGRAASAAGRSLSGDLVAGFWLINTKSLDEAVEWMQRAPFLDGDEIEIRQVFQRKISAKRSPRTARAGRAAAGAGGEEVTLASFRASEHRTRGRNCARQFSAPRFARAPEECHRKKDTHHAIHDADDPPGL